MNVAPRSRTAPLSPASRRWAVSLIAALLGAAFSLLLQILPQAYLETRMSWVHAHCDFVVFYDSAMQARRGAGLYEPLRQFFTPDGRPYTVPNLNHPLLTLLLLL